MFLEEPQIDLPYSFDAITRQWTVYGIVDQGVSLFVGHPSEGPLAIFSIDDYPDHAPPESESRFERLDDDAFSCRISNNLRIFGEICQFRTISSIGRWRPLALRCELSHAAMNGRNGRTRFAQRHALDHLHEFRRELAMACIGSCGSDQTSQPGSAVAGKPPLHGAEWDTGITCRLR